MTERYDFDATAPCGYRERPDGDFVAYGRYRDLAARLAEAEEGAGFNAAQFAEIVALRAERDALRSRLAEVELARDSWKREAEMNQQDADNCAVYAARLAEAEAQRDQMREAILWALGERDEFPTREPGQGAYWWRTELRRRAFLAADSAPATAPR